MSRRRHRLAGLRPAGSRPKGSTSVTDLLWLAVVVAVLVSPYVSLSLQLHRVHRVSAGLAVAR